MKKLTINGLRRLIYEELQICDKSLSTRLVERVSDPTYQGFRQYFIDHLLTPQHMDISREFDTITTDSFVGGKSMDIDLPALPCTFKKNMLRYMPYTKYRKISGDRGQIIRDHNHYRELLKSFVIYFVPKYDSFSAAMSPHGEFSYLIDNWLIDKNQLLSDPQYRQKVESKAPSTANLWKKFNSTKRLNSHEIIHYATSIVSDGQKYRSAGGDQQFVYDTPEYVNSTDEIQAILMGELLPDLQNLLKKPIAQIANKRVSDYVYYLARGDKKNFLRAFIYIHIIKRDPTYWPRSTLRNKARIVNRIGDFFEQHVRDKAGAVEEMRQYLASNNNKPPRPPLKYPPLDMKEPTNT